MIYYLYRHIRVDKNEPFYIGIGTKLENAGTYRQEYYRAHKFKGRTLMWRNIANKGYTIDILFESNCRSVICEKEKEFISLYGVTSEGGTLCNFTQGGENCKFTEERRLTISKRMKGNKNGVNQIFSKERCLAISERQTAYYKVNKHHSFGKKMTNDFCEKISKAKKGKLLSDAHKTALIGTRPHSKKVVCVNTGIEYNSIQDCVRKMFGCSRAIKNSISKICNGTKDNYKGYKFNFIK